MSGERWRNVLIKSIILAGGEITLGKHNFRARVQHPTNTTAGIVTPKPYLITDLTSDRFLMCSKHMGRIYALGYSPSFVLAFACRGNGTDEWANLLPRLALRSICTSMRRLARKLT